MLDDRTEGMLRQRGVITTDPAKREMCCGIERDEDGFCVYRPGHPIYVYCEACAYFMGSGAER